MHNKFLSFPISFNIITPFSLHNHPFKKKENQNHEVYNIKLKSWNVPRKKLRPEVSRTIRR